MMTKRRIARMMLAAGTVGLLILPALVYTQVTGRVLNPRLRVTYPDLQTAVNNAGPGDTLLVSGTLTGTAAILDSATDAPPDGLKIVAGRGLRGTLQISSTDCAGTPNDAVLDVSGRAGALTIMGLKIVVPNLCTGVYTDGNGNPLTVKNLLIQAATATANIEGIVIGDLTGTGESGGPFLVEDNIIPRAGSGGVGIDVFGDSTTVRRNRIGSSGAPTEAGIAVVAPLGGVVVERNIVDGGNNAGSTIGIVVGCTPSFFPTCSDDVTIQRNTVRNFVGTATPQDAVGIAIVDSTNVQVLRNVIANNDTGIGVDDFNALPDEQTADTVTINFNNITSTVTGATGLLFFWDESATVPLDATNNWWGAASGPSDIEGDADACPEAVGTACGTPQSPAVPDGTGLPVDSGAGGGTPDCGTAAGEVKTCPFRTSPVSPAGA